MDVQRLAAAYQVLDGGYVHFPARILLRLTVVYLRHGSRVDDHIGFGKAKNALDLVAVCDIEGMVLAARDLQGRSSPRCRNKVDVLVFLKALCELLPE
jgi:hypothetical protein